MYVIYWLISEDGLRTYVGFSNNFERRINEHKSGKVKSTKYFGKPTVQILETVINSSEARKREKYWKSAAGRKKLKDVYKRINGPIV